MKKIIPIFLLSFFLISNSLAWWNILQQKAEKIINNFSKRIESDPASKKNKLNIYENVVSTMYKIYYKNTLKKEQKEFLKYLIEELSVKINILDPDYYDLNWKKFVWWWTEPFWSIETDGDLVFFTDASVEKPKTEVYRVTATESEEEITLDTAVWPFFVIKRQECINDMNEEKYDYMIVIYFEWKEKFRGCVNEVLKVD